MTDKTNTTEPAAARPGAEANDNDGAAVAGPAGVSIGGVGGQSAVGGGIGTGDSVGNAAGSDLGGGGERLNDWGPGGGDLGADAGAADEHGEEGGGDAQVPGAAQPRSAGSRGGEADDAPEPV